MKKIISIPMLGAVFAAAAFAGPALADTNRPVIGGNSGWSPQTNQTEMQRSPATPSWSQPGEGVLIEGRNATTMEPNVQGVEPYIANQIEQNARSTN